MKILTVGSSSSGNSTLIFNETAAILIDCGIAVKTVLAKTQRKTFDAVLITHEHGDHIKSAGAFGRKTGAPLYISKYAVEKMGEKLKKCTLFDITDTSELQFGNMKISCFSTKHDAAHSLGFVIEEPGTKFCYLTDTGSISKAMFEKIKGCDSFFIECDYDEELIKAYPDYSQELKDRITSNYGHLSNQQGLELVDKLGIDTKRKVIFGHLSQNTNTPETLKKHIKDKFPTYVDKFIIAPFENELSL